MGDLVTELREQAKRNRLRSQAWRAANIACSLGAIVGSFVAGAAVAQGWFSDATRTVLAGVPGLLVTVQTTLNLSGMARWQLIKAATAYGIRLRVENGDLTAAEGACAWANADRKLAEDFEVASIKS
jgi:hypothetical protein